MSLPSGTSLVRPPGCGRLVQPVGDDNELLRREPNPLDVEPAERLGDADHARRSVGDRPLDEPEGACPERVVVVLRRDEGASPADERAEPVGVDEVRVQNIRPADRAPESPSRANPRVRHLAPVELVVERLRIPADQIVQPDEARVDAERAQRRQQRQQVALGAADPAHLVDVNDLHHVRNRVHSRSSATAASSANRKSQGTR
jgi:hypothetical protein